MCASVYLKKTLIVEKQKICMDLNEFIQLHDEAAIEIQRKIEKKIAGFHLKIFTYSLNIMLSSFLA